MTKPTIKLQLASKYGVRINPSTLSQGTFLMSKDECLWCSELITHHTTEKMRSCREALQTLATSLPLKTKIEQRLEDCEKAIIEMSTTIETLANEIRKLVIKHNL